MKQLLILIFFLSSISSAFAQFVLEPTQIKTKEKGKWIYRIEVSNDGSKLVHDTDGSRFFYSQRAGNGWGPTEKIDIFKNLDFPYGRLAGFDGESVYVAFAIDGKLVIFKSDLEGGTFGELRKYKGRFVPGGNLRKGFLNYSRPENPH